MLEQAINRDPGATGMDAGPVPQGECFYLGYLPVYTKRVYASQSPASITISVNPFWWMWFS
jgi:hypothetical protein